MAFSDIDSWLNMGGYAVYVWPAYGVALVMLTALIGASYRSLRLAEKQIARLQGNRE